MNLYNNIYINMYSLYIRNINNKLRLLIKYNYFSYN